MNLNFINKEFERLHTIESIIEYQFEPKSKVTNYGKRNIYYEDLKNDFIKEVNTFGFSPFILENFEKQRKNPNIMKYMDKKFNHGLTNYVKMQVKSVEVNPLSGTIIKKRPRTSKKEMKKKKVPIIENTFYLKRKEVVKEKNQKETFLEKAFENLGGNKLNISSDEDEEEKINTNIKKNDKNKKDDNKNEDIKFYNEIKNQLAEQLKEKYIKQKDFLHPLNNVNDINIIPQILISEFNKPEALKINFEKFFTENKNKDDFKKIISLSKNKDFLINNKENKITTSNIKPEIKNKNFITKSSSARFNNHIKKYKNIFHSPTQSKNEKYLLIEKSRPFHIFKGKALNYQLKLDDLVKECD